MRRGQTKPQADTKPQNTKETASRVDKVREEAKTKRMLRPKSIDKQDKPSSTCEVGSE